MNLRSLIGLHASNKYTIHWPFSDTSVISTLSRPCLQGEEPDRAHATFSVWHAAISPAHPAGSSEYEGEKVLQLYNYITIVYS